jgi:tetratricopeptide (TPR) repeat protein
MRYFFMNVIGLATAAVVALLCTGYGRGEATAADPVLPPATLLVPDTDQAIATIRSLEEKVKQNPDDFIAYTKLAGYYLQRQRETGSNEYLALAGRAARASLTILPAGQNYSGLALLAQTEQALHNFAAARDYAIQLTRLGPGKNIGFEILTDALLELGEYDGARRALDRLQNLADKTMGTQIRLGKYALLHGRTRDAERNLSEALILALQQSPPSHETVAWCRWQLGEVAFTSGDYVTAERHYRDALTTFPNFFRALASFARVRAARGDHTGAIAQYEQVIRIFPDLPFVAALGDLYQLTGRTKEAAAQYALVEQVARLSAVNGTLYNRQLSLFYADHDRNPEDAYANAVKEYAVRRDIYGADTVAWTALKAGHVVEAQRAITETLRFGTRDARLWYHAGMIAAAARDQSRAHDFLVRALKLNPEFDPWQAAIARKTLKAEQ